jgi:hypothetical protein
MKDMSEYAEFSEETLRKIAAQKVTFRFSVKIHAICYVFINILLIILNLILESTYLWFFFPLLGWLIGLVVHGLAYLLWSRGIHYGKRAIAFNITIYGFTMLLLVAINYITSGTLDWVVYPAISWGCGVAVHLILYQYVISLTTNQAGKKPSRKEQAIEKELEKMRKKRRTE